MPEPRARSARIQTLDTTMPAPSPSPDGTEVVLDVGWGRLIFAHTFDCPGKVAKAVLAERPGQRDIAFYINDPHLILNSAPQDLFLDPSNTFRLDLLAYAPPADQTTPFVLDQLAHKEDLDAINRIYSALHMVPLDIEHVWAQRDDNRFRYHVARHPDTGDILGVTLAVDHAACFPDLQNSGSLWALAVDPQAEFPGIGAALVHQVATELKSRGRALLDLSVLHDNAVAVSLYEKLGFNRVPVFAIKRRNQINEKLFIPRHSQEGYNPYAKILINEALRRGISVDPLDPPRGYFRLSLGNRRVTCRESLTDLTSAIALNRCDDKQLTRDLLVAAGLHAPAQIIHTDRDATNAFLRKHRSVVVKPLRGEQGKGVFVDLRTAEQVEQALAEAATYDDNILVEQFCEGQDLRIVVINYEVVAAAIRKPAEITGNGQHTIRELIERVSRRRQAATGGESSIPMDADTERCVREGGYALTDILPDGTALTVRRTANLHTGSTIHDVTARLSPTLAKAAIEAARVLEIPVVGLDLMVPDIEGDRYVIIEANERPGLANHEPQPTAERFIDLLFPHLKNHPDFPTPNTGESKS
ncbi:MAG: N-acetylglutaminylglutamine synthetase [Verrucomicrobiota bacterium]